MGLAIAYTDVSDIHVDASTTMSTALTEVQQTVNTVMQLKYQIMFVSGLPHTHTPTVRTTCRINPRWILPLRYWSPERIGVEGSQSQLGAFDAIVQGVSGRWGGQWKCLLG